MVFGYKDSNNTPQGWLIDFDFGGKVQEKVSYPPGYKNDLSDGRRFGEEGQSIEKWHDWYALGHIVFNLHRLRSPHKSTLPLGPEEDEKRNKIYQLRDDLYDTLNQLETLTGIENKDIEELKAFLQLAEDCNWTVGLTGRFKLDMNPGK